MGGIVGEFHQERPPVFFDMQSKMIPARAGDEGTVQALDTPLVFDRFAGGVQDDG